MYQENLAPLTVPPPIPKKGMISESDLVCPQEKSRFVILLIASIAAWLLLAITGVGLFFALLIGLFIWFAGGLLVARLRAQSVEITPKQLPELYGVFVEVCQSLGEKELPKLYVTQGGGILNAFAMRHLARNFVVLYSELLSACGTNSPEIRFILGHEIGHIRRNHVLKHLLLFPGLLLPLIGNAYRRACEKTSDRYGAYAAGNGEGRCELCCCSRQARGITALSHPRRLPTSIKANAAFLFLCTSFFPCTQRCPSASLICGRLPPARLSRGSPGILWLTSLPCFQRAVPKAS
jgi:Zn-dependent protease with chaperone function